MLRKRAFAGLRRYQQDVRTPQSEPRDIVARAGRASLSTRTKPGKPGAGRIPVVLIPSLINPPDVMDLTPRRSMLRYLLRNNHDAYVLDWGSPDKSEAQAGFASHIETFLLPLLAHFERPPILIGYCLGGTLAIGAAARLAALGQPVRAVATIATPWDFAQYTPAFRAQIAQIWATSKQSCEALGLVPMEVLQAGFWSLDPARTIRKYADFADLDADSPAYRGFLALEDWANDGAPLTLQCGRDLAQNCYADNQSGRGQWQVGGTAVDPAALACPTLAIASTRDAIVPAAATPAADARRDLALGHVGMMIGGRAEQALWAPLSDWITQQGG